MKPHRAQDLELVVDRSRILIPEPERNIMIGPLLVFALVTLGIVSWSSWGTLHADDGPVEAIRLDVASAALAASLEGLQGSTSHMVRVMADDGRVRTTLATPGIDTATIEDVLNDLRKSSGLTWLALVERNKVRAVAGRDDLRGLDLASSALFAEGDERSKTWSFGGEFLAVAAAEIQLGFTSFTLVGANAIDSAILQRLAERVGVSVALVVEGKRSAEYVAKPEYASALESAAAAPVGSRVITVDGSSFATRIDQLGDGARAPRAVWLSQASSSRGGRTTKLVLAWGPSAIAFFGLIALAFMAWRERTV